MNGPTLEPVAAAAADAKQKRLARSAPPAAAVVLEAREAARAARLRYVTDAAPGITRKRVGRNFAYRLPDGTPLRDPAEKQRIQSLGIPPAWTGVWICPNPKGHIQATGRDARGRKQYRYHPEWRAVRDETKFGRMLAFARALPRLRRRVEADLAMPGLRRERVLAAVVRLLDATLIRVGNEEYARQNGSFGLTTLRSDHIEVAGEKLAFRFRGKSGKDHEVGVRDRRLARLLRHCQELPGQALFQYRDEDGEFRAIDSEDVNRYLREATGDEFSAKDFRTWGGTVLAVCALQECGPGGSDAGARKGNVLAAIDRVTERLGNTRAVCRRYYIHPEVFAAYEEGSLPLPRFPQAADAVPTSEDLRPEERAVLRFLKQRLVGK